jgi:3-oxoacyl-[acyl-carrier protein] reductase
MSQRTFIITGAASDIVAGPIAFLLSDDASFITGQTLFINGGSNVGRVQI